MFTNFFFLFLFFVLFIPFNFLIVIFFSIFILNYFVFNFDFLVFFLFLPLINVIFSYFCLKFFLNKKIILFNSVLVIFLIFLKSCYFLIHFLLNLDLNLNLNFIYVLNLTNYSEIEFFFKFDVLTFCMIFTITFISFLVHFYSIDYMLFDKNQINFLLILNLFTFFMLFLVNSGSVLQLFIG